MIRITCAPSAYDYDYVKILETLPYASRSANQYRKIELPDDDNGYLANYQVMRYQSGMYPCLTEEMFRQWVDDGVVYPTDET